MGTSMSKVVFTENVIRGIHIWHAKAKKNMALRNPNSERSTLETSPSLQTSLEASPSFSLDASFSILVDRPLDDKYMDYEEKVNNEQQESENQGRKPGSFYGFDLQKEGK